MSVTIYAENDNKTYLNVCNRNFATFWNALGLDIQVVSDFGISFEQISRYVQVLKEICEIAKKAEKTVIWY